MRPTTLATRNDPAPSAPVPLACVVGAISPAERGAHVALLERLFSREVLERRELPDGRAYRFAADAFDDVARWVANERRCCPFLRLELVLAPAEGPLWLRLTGPAGTHAFLDAELPPPTPDAAA